MTFAETLTAAVRDFTEHGYDSPGRLEHWMTALRLAAEESLTPRYRMEEMLREALGAVYRRLVEKGGITKMHPGVARFTLERIAPRLRAELDRRILASADLIKINRTEAINKTLQRFAGWSTSIPAGGSRVVDKPETKDEIRKSLAQLPFVERRVLIDQGHKLNSALSEIVATDGGAVAAVWHSHWRQAGYDYREDHKERDGETYLVRGSWAQRNGLVRASEVGYTDSVTKPGEEPFCRCNYRYLYHLRELPTDMLTNKGRAELARLRVA